jgi:Mn2+/Fe2+ NRAMP family transporter
VNSRKFDPYHLPADAVREPPTTWWGMLRMIGPGIILAGTIVGSGELLVTTGLGARTGYVFLWLILFSCVIKVFVQIELGRYAIASGKPTLGALNEIALPRFGANLLVWWWFVMMLATVFQLGGMTNAVGQSLHQTFPNVQSFIKVPFTTSRQATELLNARPEIPWAFFVGVATILLLWSGSYRRLERVTTAIVVSVTFLTVAATVALPWTPFPILWDQALLGLNPLACPFHDQQAIFDAFTVFGITGVGATELFYYPYWCLEKGYARYVGYDDGSDDRRRRAHGWIRVLYIDAWASMAVFTLSTVAFYFMGASVLHPQKLNPSKSTMIDTLSRMFVDSFGDWTRSLFLIGAAAVLFKTLYLSCAGNARMTADFFGLTKLKNYSSSEERNRWIHWLSLIFPIMALVLALWLVDPKLLVGIGGCAQAATLPMIAIAAVYFRFRRLDRNLAPSRAWDIVLVTAAVLISLVAAFTFIKTFIDLTAGK